MGTVHVPVVLQSYAGSLNDRLGWIVGEYRNTWVLTVNVASVVECACYSSMQHSDEQEANNF